MQSVIMGNSGSYIVLTADIVNSRKYSMDQLKWKDRLLKINQELVEHYPDLVVTPFTLSRGDELQSILSVHKALPLAIRLLRYHFIPLKLRLGIGIGDISTDDMRTIESSWSATGTAFFHSRDSLDALKKEKKQTTTIKSNYILTDEIVNGFYLLIDVIESAWSDKQWEAVYLYEKEATFAKAASNNKTSPQNVFSTYKRSNFAKVKEVEKIIGKLIYSQIANEKSCLLQNQTL